MECDICGTKDNVNSYRIRKADNEDVVVEINVCDYCKDQIVWVSKQRRD